MKKRHFLFFLTLLCCFTLLLLLIQTYLHGESTRISPLALQQRHVTSQPSGASSVPSEARLSRVGSAARRRAYAWYGEPVVRVLSAAPQCDAAEGAPCERGAATAPRCAPSLAAAERLYAVDPNTKWSIRHADEEKKKVQGMTTTSMT